LPPGGADNATAKTTARQNKTIGGEAMGAANELSLSARTVAVDPGNVATNIQAGAR
jgi:Mn2+/Fe2+ NRAMP family transporter